MLISFLGVLVGAVGMVLTRMFAGREYVESNAKLKEVQGIIYPEFAEALLKKHGRQDYVVQAGCGDFGGVCDYKNKQLHLTAHPGSKNFAAIWEAAHEVGHAVHGQLAFHKPLAIISSLIMLAILTTCGSLFAAKWVLTLDLFVILLVSYYHWKDEARASTFAAKELSELVGRKIVSSRLALDKLILAMESLSMAIVLWSAYSLLYFL